jgi:hypothetical protein
MLHLAYPVIVVCGAGHPPPLDDLPHELSDPPVYVPLLPPELEFRFPPPPVLVPPLPQVEEAQEGGAQVVDA